MSNRASKNAVSAPTTALPPLRGGGYPGAWAGRFIWYGGESVPYHCHLMCRKTFDLDAPPTEARILVAVADKYMLYVNGEYIGRGPCRTPGPQWVSYDTHDLTTRLRPGRNVVAVMAYCYGCPNNFSVDQRAGLWTQLEAAMPGGQQITVGTDASWKVRRAEGWRRDVRVVNSFQGMPIEIYEAGKDPEDWMAVTFDDAGWESAVALSSDDEWGPVERRAAWEYLEPRLTPLLREREVFPVKILRVAEAAPRQDGKPLAETDVPERLDAETHLPLEKVEAVAADSLVAGGAGKAVFTSRDGRDPVLILDFGRPYMGIPRLHFDAAAGAVVEMTFGNTVTDGRVFAPSHVPSLYGDRYVAREGSQTWQPFEHKTGTRFLQVVFRTDGKPLTLRSVSLISQEYPVEERGAFACSDDTLSKLWRAGVDTNYLHLEDCYTCDSVRERHAYLMAGEIEQSHWAYYAAYGDIAATDLNFRHTTRGQIAGGQLRCFMIGSGNATRGFPLRTLPLASAATATFMPTYSALFAEAVLNRQRWFPKPGFVEEHYGALTRLAEWFERQSGEDGLIVNAPPIVWFDWPNFRKWSEAEKVRGANFAVNALWYRMQIAMAELASRVGRADDQARYAAQAERLRTTLRREFWDAERGLYADVVDNGQRLDLYGELLNALALLFNIATDEQRPAIVKNLLAPPADLTRVSPLYFNYVLEALLREGEDAYVWRYAAERYRPILALSDFPTLVEEWEDSPNGINSTIHGTPGGVVLTLSTYALGVFPLEDGFRRVRIQPHPGGLTWARGVLPTAAGEIGVEWRKTESEFRLDVRLPEGVNAEFRVPSGEESRAVITCNGRPVAASGHHR